MNIAANIMDFENLREYVYLGTSTEAVAGGPEVEKYGVINYHYVIRVAKSKEDDSICQHLLQAMVKFEKISLEAEERLILVEMYEDGIFGVYMPEFLKQHCKFSPSAINCDQIMKVVDELMNFRDEKYLILVNSAKAGISIIDPEKFDKHFLEKLSPFFTEGLNYNCEKINTTKF